MRQPKTAPDHDVYLKTKYFPALDGLRALSVFLVFAMHFGGEIAGSRVGWLGVYVFFVLSGYLITTLLLREWDATGFVSLKAFYIRRSTRLLPAYFLVYLMMMVVSYFQSDTAWAEMKAATPYFLTFMNEFAASSPFGLTWSLGVEWKYYMVWPLLLVMFGRTSGARFAVAMVCLGVALVIMLGQLHPVWLTPWGYFGLILGSLTALLLHSRAGYERLRCLTGNKAAFFLAFVLFVWYRRADWIESRIGMPLMVAVFCTLVALLMPALIANNTYVARVMGWRPLVFIGQRSYAMYLLQVIAALVVIFVLPGTTVGPLLLFGSFAVALVAAHVLYQWFERPIARWGHGWAEAVKEGAGDTQPAPGAKLG
ncbi:acyltransferase family protein [Variovorax sp. VaC1]|uniref:acyltransferase family protein n=1 Tax=Variovorax sp. VaC1 TaxID=3373132 RepID=UPI003749477D